MTTRTILTVLVALCTGCQIAVTSREIRIQPAVATRTPSPAPRPAPPSPPPTVAAAPSSTATAPPVPPPTGSPATVPPSAASAAPAPAVAAAPEPEPVGPPPAEPLVALPEVVPPPTNAVSLYVALAGEDSGAGTREAPFATLARAQRAVRELLAQGTTSNIVVYLRAGIYELPETLVFGPEDGGRGEQQVVYRALPGERVVLSGGRRVRGWTRGAAGSWQVVLPEVRDGTWWFRDLYVNGQRAMRARYPATDKPDQYPKVVTATLSKDRQRWEVTWDGAMPGHWKHVADLEFVGLQLWEITRKPVEQIDPATKRIVFRGPHFEGNTFTVPAPGVPCFLENSRDFLAGPGQWSLERETGLLNYRPRSGEQSEATPVIAPVLTQLIRARGTPGQPVRNLYFDGLEFAHTDWPLAPTGFRGNQAGFNWTPQGFFQPAAVEFEFAEDCGVRDSRFSQLGGAGIGFRKGCRRNVIAGNLIEDVGANGILVGDDKDPGDSPAATKHNLVINNLVRRCGRTYFGAVGIWVGFTEGTAVRHNRIYDLPYSALSVGWQWDTKPTACKSNWIEFNHLSDAMKVLKDGGGLYTLGFQPGTVLRGNVIDRIGGYGGIYLDNGSSGYYIESNAVRQTWTPLKLNSERAAQRWGFNFFEAPHPSTGKFGQGLWATRDRSSYARAEFRAADAPDGFTISAWIKQHKHSGTAWIFSKAAPTHNDEFGLAVQRAQLVGRLNIGGGTAGLFTASTGPNAIQLNHWHHVGLTFGDQVLRLYLDGALVAETAIPARRSPRDGPVAIGSQSSGLSGLLEGVVDEVRFYRRALTPEEMAALYRTPQQPPAAEALVRHWDFEDLTDPYARLNDIVKLAGLQEPYRSRYRE